MKKLSPIAYVPRRETLQSASLAPVALYLGAYLLVCFFSSDPLVLVAATAGAALAGYGCGAGRAVGFSLRLGGFLALTMIIVNALVTNRGATVLARLGDWPILGQVEITAEAIAAGAVIGLRVIGTMVVIGVWSACVDPDRILQAVHGVARRSALTATLISRLVPLAATDYARIGEAAELRGPAAAPVGRGAMAHAPIQVMEMEHDAHGQNLRRMRELAHDFAPPPDACGTWKALY
ncbi:MAG TPA: CbiQ family ECF transporter T component, partial [Solirubrobacterales bacterium]|nr:CbiQ family ECF transporter T component [Solirubrobacterales bacterium]